MYHFPFASSPASAETVPENPTVTSLSVERHAFIEHSGVEQVMVTTEITFFDLGEILEDGLGIAFEPL